MGIKSIGKIRLWVAYKPRPLRMGRSVEQNPFIGGRAHIEAQYSQRVGPPTWEGQQLPVKLFLVRHLLCFQSVSEAAELSWILLHPHPGPQHLHSPLRSSA